MNLPDQTFFLRNRLGTTTETSAKHHCSISPTEDSKGSTQSLLATSGSIKKREKSTEQVGVRSREKNMNDSKSEKGRRSLRTHGRYMEGDDEELMERGVVPG